MNLLFISPFFPHSKVCHAGGKFTYEIIKALSQRHQIHLLSRIEPDQSQFVDEMKKFCTAINLFIFETPKNPNILNILRIALSYLSLGLMANRLIKRANFDLIHVEHTETALFIKKIKPLPMVLVAHDVITKPAKRRYLAAKGMLNKILFLLRWKVATGVENYITRKCDMIFTMSEQDKEILLRRYKILSTTMVGYPVLDTIPSIAYNREPGTVLFAGAMHRDVNVQSALYFYRKVLPRIRQEIPNLKFYIVGNNPDPRVKNLPSMDKDVIVTGFVEEMEPYYRKATVFVSPLFVGGGIIVKNLQAMASGLPVVTTSIGNEGIEAVPDRDIFVADDPEVFAEKVLLLLKNAQKWREIAENGRMFVMKRYSVESVVNRIESGYDLVLGGPVGLR